MKRPRLRPQAEQDLVAAALNYREQGGARLAARFFDAALASLDVVARMAGMGSPRMGQACDIPELRTWVVTGFPFLWFYFDRPDGMDVLRLLGERHDILAILTEPQ